MQTETTYEYREDSYRQDLDADSFPAALEAGRELLLNGDWAENSGTFWVHAWICETVETDGNDREIVRDQEIRVAINPPEPSCSADEHDWQDSSVRGNGGGVVITEVCVHCDCMRITDTWAQDPTNGEQGLKSVAYDEEYVRDMRQAAEEYEAHCDRMRTRETDED